MNAPAGNDRPPMASECSFDGLTPANQERARATFLGARRGDGYVYSLASDGVLLARRPARPDAVRARAEARAVELLELVEAYAGECVWCGGQSGAVTHAGIYHDTCPACAHLREIIKEVREGT